MFRGKRRTIISTDQRTPHHFHARECFRISVNRSRGVANTADTARISREFRRKDGEATEFLVLPSAFHEMCDGFNIRTAAKFLIEKGVLTPADDGKSQKARRLPGMGKVTKFYYINGGIWD